MDQDQKTQLLLSQTQAALRHSDQAIKNSQTTLAKLDDELKKIEDKNNKAQAVIDQEIVNIIQDMDEATVQFVKDTE
ncbi:hypothetical protein CO134_00835 [Candidatus Kuenenbacteria bacterium CG_4_9_14_3_um_filter_39_14]|uniref:Uncharacterized protein n=5 Tax=Candidatus Kueneniibacteriota TaxID=1752740 RepID=A0A2M7ILM1_9BACT|nr:MAG: hypothetical protein COX28_00780 [Candidatus Kuenenbacteria bacterium CG23_combo_of_CG06-09_8_20_14_all_39_39]PIP75634.1 MAG: hypothetical protein COW86_02665 [Candidatus Kuenenbacteria bacterium CG22_combo_CG10-13_8_21_14_all_39_9]PIR80727.1 MAG: hypothetical protein COU24_02385 [Candidatus Kuenenbacteria bacterium CG10_big_fil_rev_8_21_14_0_10_39_14]PIW95745.1 MAG: hypothetical protein COZ84_01825 [Candidatus Kuenenbacteria bacterium CG_4_8_14_3_um_filter_39_15]PJA92300.1 MAG: hypothe